MAFVFEQFITEAIGKKDEQLLYYFGKEYSEQLATYDSVTEEYTILLPVAAIPVNDIMGGVRDVNFNNSRDLNFIPVSIEQYKYNSGQNVYLVDEKIRYITLSDRLIFISGINETNEDMLLVNGLKLRILVSLDDYGYGDQIPFPNGRTEDFILKVVNLNRHTRYCG